MYLGNSQIKKKKNDGGPCVLANQNLGAYVWAGLIVCLNWVIVGHIFSGSEKMAYSSFGFSKVTTRCTTVHFGTTKETFLRNLLKMHCVVKITEQ